MPNVTASYGKSLDSIAFFRYFQKWTFFYPFAVPPDLFLIVLNKFEEIAHVYFIFRQA